MDLIALNDLSMPGVGKGRGSDTICIDAALRVAAKSLAKPHRAQRHRLGPGQGGQSVSHINTDLRGRAGETSDELSFILPGAAHAGHVLLPRMTTLLLLIGLSTLVMAAEASSVFDLKVTIGVVTEGQQPVIVDFDKDGGNDIITAGKIWRNTGGGASFVSTNLPTLSRAGKPPAGPFPVRTFAVTDVDNDGWVDIFGIGGTLACWYRGSTTPQFAQVMLPSPPSPATLTNAVIQVVADVNHDSLLDVVITLTNNTGSNSSLWAYMINSTHHFTPSRIGGIPSQPYKFVRGNLDVDGDLRSDLVVTVLDGTCTWYRNLGTGAYIFGGEIPRVSADSTFQAITTADIDQDGRIDIVGAGSAGVHWYRNNGSGGFENARNVDAGLASTQITALSVFDVDFDGIIDVVCSNSTGAALVWYKNVGGGTFSSATVIDGAAGVIVALAGGDLTSDGEPDVVVVSSANNMLMYGARFQLDFQPREVCLLDSITMRHVFLENLAVANLDGAGLLDVVGSTVSGQLFWVRHNGSGFDLPSIIQNVSAPQWIDLVGLADMNQDGRTDVVCIIQGTASKLVWYQNNPNLTFTERLVRSNMPAGSFAVVVDLNQDNAPDIMFSNTLGTSISQMLNSGVGEFLGPTVAGQGSANALYVADMNQDGVADLVLRENGGASWLRGTVVGSALQFTTPSVSLYKGTTADAFGIADVNSDGYPDVIRAATLDGSVGWIRNDRGFLFFDEKQIAASGIAPFALGVHATDIDGDGDQDLVVGQNIAAGAIEPSVAWFSNEGRGIFKKQARIATPGSEVAGTCLVADMDGDGRKDLLVTTLGGIYWYPSPARPSRTMHATAVGNDTECALNPQLPCRTIRQAIAIGARKPGLIDVSVSPGLYIEGDRLTLDSRAVILRTTDWTGVIEIRCTTSSECLRLGIGARALHGSFWIRGGVTFINAVDVLIGRVGESATAPCTFNVSGLTGTQLVVTFQNSVVAFFQSEFHLNGLETAARVTITGSVVKFGLWDLRHSSTGTNSVLEVASASTLSGLEMLIYNCSTSATGGGLRADGSLVDVSKLTLSGNSAVQGGGASVANCSVITAELVLSNNKASRQAGGFRLQRASRLSIVRRLDASDNNADLEGGGAFVAISSSLRLADMASCQMIRNSASFGGAVVVSESDLTIKNCTMAYNEARGGAGGAVYSTRTTIQLTNCVMQHNQAASLLEGKGGAVYIEASAVELSTITLRNNTAYQGGGIYCSGAALLESILSIRHSTIFQNKALMSGGGLAVDYCGLISDGDAWSQNEAQGFPCTSDAGGGAFFILRNRWRWNMTSITSVRDNMAQCHGGAFLLSPLASDAVVNGTQSLITNNSAVTGGGGALFWSPTDLQLTTTPGVFVGLVDIRTEPISNNFAAYGPSFATPKVLLKFTNSSAMGQNHTSGQLFVGSLAVEFKDAYDQTAVSDADRLRILYDSSDVLVGPGASVLNGITNYTNALGLRGYPGSLHSITFRIDLPITAGTAAQERMTLTGSFFLSECTAGTKIEDDVCRACEIGSYSNRSSVTFCTPCGFGTFTNVTGQAICRGCSPGRYNDLEGASSCRLCETGSVAPQWNASACTPCKPGEYVNTTGQLTCNNCTRGSYSESSGASTCRDCPAGTISPDDGGVQCTDCQRGRYRNASGAWDCLDCSNGTYAESEGLRNCAACPPGRFGAGEKLQSCELCPFGSYTNQSGRDHCEPCPAGRSSTQQGASVCRDCEVGTFQNTSNPLEPICQACPAGFVTNTTGRVSCDRCPGGRYADRLGSSFCRTCDAGFVAMGLGNVRCTSCGKGEYTNVTGEEACARCSKGTYNDAKGSSFCRDCEAGSYADGDGSEICTLCQLGRFASNVRQTGCDGCSEGSAADRNGSTLCRPCESGYAAPFRNMSECLICRPGEYANTTSAKKCIECPSATYTEFQGASFCRECEPGTFSTAVGAAKCIQCNAGTYAERSRQQSCSPCGIGSYSDRNGSSFCLACPSGRVQSIVGQTACVSCDFHHYIRDDDTNRSRCDSCPYPSYALRNGSSFCDYCIVGFYSVWRSNRTEFGGCERCPTGALCDPFLGTVQAAEDHWLSTNTLTGEVNAFTCPPKYCMGGECGVNRRIFEDNPLCGSCADGFYEWDGDCVPCTNETNTGFIYLVFLISLLCVWFYHRLCQKSSAELGITMLFIQMASVILTTSRGPQSRFMQWFNFNLLEATAGSRCLAPLTPEVKLSLFLITTITVFVEWLLLATVSSLWRHFRHRQGLPIITFGRSAIALYLLTFTNMIQGGFRVFDCVGVSIGDVSVSVIRSYPAVSCDSVAYRSILYASIVGVAVYLAVVPMALLWAVAKYGKLQPNGEESTGFQILKIIHGCYDAMHPFGSRWEFVKMFARTAALASLVFVEDYTHRLAGASIAFACYLLLLLHVRPYVLRVYHGAEEASMMILLLLCHTLLLVGPAFSDGENVLLIVITLSPSVAFTAWLLLMKWLSVVHPLLETYATSSGKVAKWDHETSRRQTWCSACLQYLVLQPSRRLSSWWSRTQNSSNGRLSDTRLQTSTLPQSRAPSDGTSTMSGDATTCPAENCDSKLALWAIPEESKAVELGLGSPLSHRQLESTEELYDVVHDRADVLKAP